MAPINRITKSDLRAFASIVANLNAIDQYQSYAAKSAIYPGQGTPLGLAYVALKLNGEAGEFAEHVGKAMRDDSLIESGTYPWSYVGGALTPERRDALIKEIGDLLWYASAACRELGISLSEAAQINLEKLYDRGQRDALRGSGDNR